MTVYRQYDCEYYSLSVPATSCFFCKHCTDIWFDFTNGPYMFWCDVEESTEKGVAGACDEFIDEAIL